MTALNLDGRRVPAVAVALRDGHVVVLSGEWIAVAPAHQHGAERALARYLGARAGGQVVVKAVPRIGRLLAFSPPALERAGHDPYALVDELQRINADDDYTEAARILDRVQAFGELEVLGFEVRA